MSPFYITPDSPLSVSETTGDTNSTGGRDRDTDGEVHSAENRINRQQTQAREEHGLGQPRGGHAGTRGAWSHSVGSSSITSLSGRAGKGVNRLRKCGTTGQSDIHGIPFMRITLLTKDR